MKHFERDTLLGAACVAVSLVLYFVLRIRIQRAFSFIYILPALFLYGGVVFWFTRPYERGVRAVYLLALIVIVMICLLFAFLGG